LWSQGHRIFACDGTRRSGTLLFAHEETTPDSQGHQESKRGSVLYSDNRPHQTQKKEKEIQCLVRPEKKKREVIFFRKYMAYRPARSSVLYCENRPHRTQKKRKKNRMSRMTRDKKKRSGFFFENIWPIEWQEVQFYTANITHIKLKKQKKRKSNVSRDQ
jgi:hypothetical protein